MECIDWHLGLRWRLRRLFLEDGILASQPSPLGEGAPKERIGHWRYERQLRKAERCAAHVGKAAYILSASKKPQRESLDSLCGFFDGNREENSKRASPIYLRRSRHNNPEL